MQAQKTKGAALKSEGIELNDIERMMLMLGGDEEPQEPSNESAKDSKQVGTVQVSKAASEREDTMNDSHESNIGVAPQNTAGGRP